MGHFHIMLYEIGLDQMGLDKVGMHQKIDNLPVLATCRSGTLAMLSSKVNGPVAHGSTR